MCGIAGLFHFTDEPVSADTLRRMTVLLAHRGPDDYGYAFFDRAGHILHQGREIPQRFGSAALALGHRRLSILDLTETGRQPMTSAAGRFCIVFNGEIYNYLELQKELRAAGFSFFGTSDTEVILKAYEHWGPDCVTRFNGMWAFALWDAAEQTLFCSRDRFGVKPLYYYRDSRRFCFASEIKSVLAGIETDTPRPNGPYLARFIFTGHKNNSEQTFFENVYSLLPAQCIEVRASGVRQWSYWDIPADSAAEESEIDAARAAEQFRDLLRDSIRLQFRSDVPVGMCLSGGLDSSSIVALARYPVGPKLHSVTSEYPAEDYSDGQYARRVAEEFQTRAFYITPSGEQFIDFIDRFSWYHDEPCPGPGPFSQWHVMRLASRHVKVVLEGQGADELLAGYTYYMNYLLAGKLRDVFAGKHSLRDYAADIRHAAAFLRISPRRMHVGALRHAVYSNLPPAAITLARKLRKSLEPAFSDNPLLRLLSPDLRRQALPFPEPVRKFADPLREILYRDLTRDNLPMLLQYGDRTSMAFSVESRVPFLDHRLVEFAMALPSSCKIRDGWTKFILRQAMKDILPDEIVHRPDKKGFPTPFARWLKSELRDYTLDMFQSRTFRQRGIFNPEQAMTLYQQHCDGTADHSWLLWRILNLERWLQTFIDNFRDTAEEHAGKEQPSNSSLLPAGA